MTFSPKRLAILSAAILVIMVICVSGFAVAQYYGEEYKRLDMTLDNSIDSLLAEPRDEGEVKTYYTDAYYKHCRAANASPSLDYYNESQCACTAAGITETMTSDEVKTMFERSDDGNYTYARMLMLSYLPCLAQTLKYLSYELCEEENYNEFFPARHKKLCTCISEKTERYVEIQGRILFPGFKRLSFDKDNAVNDPLSFALQHDNLQRHRTSHIRQCTLDIADDRR